MSLKSVLEHSPLGKSTVYEDCYNPKLLYPIPRTWGRQEIGIGEALPFQGHDCWNGYEVSWLNLKGKPEMRLLELIIPCDSTNLVESKSLKLYLYSFNNSQFLDEQTVCKQIREDISLVSQSEVKVALHSFDTVNHHKFHSFQGYCLDDLNLAITQYTACGGLLEIDSQCVVEETLYTNLLKSNCPLTHKPDWGSVKISYRGRKLNPESVLRFIISLRDNNEFHEQCIERIFMMLTKIVKPVYLIVEGRYTRRGSLDINPYRSSHSPEPLHNLRMFRQ